LKTKKIETHGTRATLWSPLNLHDAYPLQSSACVLKRDVFNMSPQCDAQGADKRAPGVETRKKQQKYLK
jgi:hypothetical protein